MVKFAIPEKLKSRKLWMSLLSASIVFCNQYFGLGLSENEVILIVTSLLSYVGVEGLVDVTKAKSTTTLG